MQRIVLAPTTLASKITVDPAALARDTAALLARVCAVIACAAADTAWTRSDTATIDWGASIRTRFENKQDFNFEQSSQSYLLSQARLHLQLDTAAGNGFLIELQDARISGESRSQAPPIDEDATPNVFADPFDLHQAYWRLDTDKGRITVGRQKLNLGDRRLVASLEWVNTARVHDGVRVTLGDPQNRSVDAFATALVPVDPNDFNDQARVDSRYLDSLFHGAIVTDRAMLDAGELQYWYFYRENEDFGDRTQTLGIRFTDQNGDWRPDLQFAYQAGEFGGEDHSAWMTHLGARRAFSRGRLDVSYTHASGDPDPADSEHQTFDNLFPLNHPYYGHMDLFSLQNIRNVEVAYSVNLADDMTLRIGWNEFWLAHEDSDAWYNAGLGQVRLAAENVSARVGREIDLTIQKALLDDRVRLAAGVSAFLAGRYLADFASTENAYFFFASLFYSTR